MQTFLALLPLALIFALVLQALAPSSPAQIAKTALALALGFAVAQAGLLLFAGLVWAWVGLVAGLGLSAAGLVAAGGFGARTVPAAAAPLLGFCAAFAATPIPHGALGYAAMLALGTAAHAMRSKFSKRPVDGILLLIAGALVANGSYAGIGFWLVEWFG